MGARTKGKAADLTLVDFGQFMEAKRAEVPPPAWKEVASTAAFLVLGMLFLAAFAAAAPPIAIFLRQG